MELQIGFQFTFSDPFVYISFRYFRSRAISTCGIYQDNILILQILALAAVLVYLPLAVMSDSLPHARLIFYAALAVLAVIEVFVGSLLIHGAFKVSTI